MHNQHPIGNIRHHPHIVGDEYHPHLHLLLQHLNQLQDLGLNGDIQRRGGFVRNEHRRTARQRHRNHHPLAHATGKLMRIAGQNRVRLRDTYQLQHPFSFVERLITAQSLMQADRFGNLLAHREDRVQGGHRLLKNHRNIRPAHPLHPGRAQLVEIDNLTVATAQQHPLAGDLPARLLKQTHQRQRGNGFTGT